MKILLVGSYQYEMYAPAFSYGFRKLGHEIIEVDYQQFHLKGNGGLATILNRIQDRYHYGIKMYAYNKSILDTVNREHPDMVFLYRCCHVYTSTLQKIKGKAILISYNNDDPFSGTPSDRYFRHHIANARCCDINYVYRKKNIADYAAIGITNTKVLLPYYLSWQNYPIECEKDIPIAFLGHFENDGRDMYILHLKEAGLPVVVYGDSAWKDAPLFERIKDVFYSDKRGVEYNQTMNRCQICLVFLSKINHDTYTRRCFEIPATRGVMLCEYTDDMNELYPENECAVYFRSKEELVEKAQWLLDNPDEINRISQNAYDRAFFLGCSEIDRCRSIIKDIKRVKELINT